jgi:hypothetical protein
VCLVTLSHFWKHDSVLDERLLPDDAEAIRVQCLLWRLTPDELGYLKSIFRYNYSYSKRMTERLNELGLVSSFDQLVVITDDGRAVVALAL